MARSQSRLQVELKQNKAFDSLAEEAFVAVVKTADMLLRLLDRKLITLGLSHQQYNVLRIMRGAGAPGIPTLAIGERLIECAPGMTRLLDRLEQKGLVRRERCKLDRRQVLCYITCKGEQLLKQAGPLVDGLAQHSFENLPPGQLESFIEMLEHIRERVEQM